MIEETNPVLKTAVLETVDKQLRDNDPPEAKKTYKRLRREGYSHQEARELIAAVLFQEMYDVLKYRRSYDEEKYAKNLKRLSKLPGD